MPTERAEPLRAAGGVVWRDDEAGCQATDRLIAMVHRPAYDDWSLPKGKPRPGEDAMATAVREVHEETGVHAAVQGRLGSVAYQTQHGLKLVEHFILRGLDGGLSAQPPHEGEVDGLRWISIDAALSLATYDTDRGLIETFGALPRITSTIALVRHARAGKRSQWNGADDLRPLSRRGERQAGKLAPALEALAPQRILAAPPVRCVSTVEPLAERLGLPVEIVDWAADEQYAADPTSSAAALMMCARSGTTSVICSQGDAIPGLLRTLLGPTSDYATSKGAFWVVSFAGGAAMSVDRHPAPTP